MPKYRVLVEKVVQYLVEVDAPDLCQAGGVAMEVVRTTDDVEQYLHAESGMEVAHIYKEGKALGMTC